MVWSASVDLYCERTDPSFWSEPANALTNIAFLVAAALAYLRWRGSGDVPIGILILMVVAVGIGSFAFHTFATRWSALADVLPIQVFIAGYFLLAMRRFLGISLGPAIVVTVAFIAAAFVMPWLFPPSLRGSAGYAGGLLALFGVAGALASGWGSRSIAALAVPSLLTTGAVFFVSLLFRSLDLTLCAANPVGTHLAWHLLNAVVLYRLLRLAMLAPPLVSGR